MGFASRQCPGVALSILLAGTAMAGPGDHIRTGDTTIVPDIDLGMEYRTNTYRAPSDPVAGANLRIAPGLEVDVDSDNNAFTLGGEWEIRKYVFLATESPEFRQELIRAIDRFNDFNIGAELDLLKKESVGLRIRDQVALRNNSTDRGVLGNPFVTQVRNALGGGLRISPGEALDIVPGAEWAYDDYRIADSNPFRSRFNSRNTYGPRLDVRWDFFPRTGFVLEGSGMFHTWNEPTVAVQDPVSGVAGVIAVPDSVHVKVLTGLAGRFTERVFIDLLVGYGNALYEPSVGGVIDEAAADLKGVQGLIGSVQTRYKLMRENEASAEVSVGFKRDFDDAFFTNYVAYNHVFGSAAFAVGGFRPRIKHSIRFEDYSGAVVRDDVLNRFDSEIAYAFRDWGEVSGGMSWQQRGIVQTALKSAEYDEFTFGLKSTWTY